MTKVRFDEFYIWRQDWYKSEPCGERLGQAFCNHFYETVGRGDHTTKLFYSVDDLYSEKIIYENFIEFN